MTRPVERVADNAMYGPDPALGARPKPGFSDHDARGWRNKEALDRADIVAIGDSQTYGLGGVKENAWPQQLGSILAQTTYQIAFGGYAPPHFVRLSSEIFSLRPKYVVVGLYFGAQFTSSYLNVYFRAKDNGIEGLKSNDPEWLKVLSTAHHIDGDWWIRAQFMDCQLAQYVPDARLLQIKDILSWPPLGPLQYPWIARNSDFLRRAASRMPKPSATVLAAPYCVDFKKDGIEAILTPSYRLINLEPTDPRNLEGERNTVDSIIALKDEAIRNSAKLVVVLIPTKELAFSELATGLPGEQTTHLRRLWASEISARSRVSERLRSNGIAVCDALPSLQSMLRTGSDPYQGATGDGHPSASGYRAIAETVATEIRSLQ
ncbi:hypothetical protein Bra471DRAFT_05411 [Bradyrhizobium sp. WSM471]|nr:hypothetical protein Bra471DRAFT_05411 [Bradyrhizobium sp. WSM471]